MITQQKSKEPKKVSGIWPLHMSHALTPGCLQEPDGVPIELGILLDSLYPVINNLVIRECLTALFEILNSES